MYLNDAGNYRVIRFPPNSKNGTIIAGINSTTGTTLNVFSTGMRGVYVDNSSNVYVADAYNNRVVLWLNGSSTGTLVAGNGTFGTTLNQVYYPYGVWVDSNSNIYVSEYQSHRVTKWAQGASSGVVVAGITGVAGRNDREHDPPPYEF